MLRFADDITIVTERKKDLKQIMQKTMESALKIKINAGSTKILVCIGQTNIEIRIKLNKDMMMDQIFEIRLLR